MAVVRDGTLMRTLPRMALMSSAPSNPATPSRLLSSSPAPPPPAPMPSSPPSSSPPSLPATPALSPPFSSPAPTPMHVETTATPTSPTSLATRMPSPPSLMLAPGSTPPPPISPSMLPPPKVAPSSSPSSPDPTPIRPRLALRHSMAECQSTLWRRLGTSMPSTSTSPPVVVILTGLTLATSLHYATAGGYLDVTEFLIGRSAYDAWLARTRDGQKMPFDLTIDGGTPSSMTHLDWRRAERSAVAQFQLRRQWEKEAQVGSQWRIARRLVMVVAWIGGWEKDI